MSKILEVLQEKFESRPDQKRKRADDETKWAKLLTKKNSGMQCPQKRANGRFKAMIHQLFGLTVAPDADVGAQSPDIKYFVKQIGGLTVLKHILALGVPDLLDMHRTFVRESAGRAAERMKRHSAPLERCRGDAFSGGRSSIIERHEMHRYWKAAMKAAHLLHLGKEVAV